jgi:hypothetical protein
MSYSNDEIGFLLGGETKEFAFMNPLQEVTARMLKIERINMDYNKATTFGQFPNGQEAEIEALLSEWDSLKVRRLQLKYNSPLV